MNTARFFAVVRRLNSVDNLFSDTYYGNIALVIQTSLLDDICSQYTITENSRVFIVNNHMEIAGRMRPTENLYSDDLILTISKNPKEYTNFTLNNMKYLSMVHPLGDIGWNAVIIIPKKEYFSELTRITLVTIIIFLVLLIIIAVFSILVIKSVTSPINALLKAMENVSTGNLKFRIPLSLRNETGKLAEHFNQTMDEVYNLTSTIVKNQKSLYEAELANKDAKMKTLQSQINPHFLYNTLGCMRSIARKYSAEEVLEMSTALIKVLRYSIKEADFVLVCAELENLKDYILIYEISLSGKFDFVLNVEPEILGYKINKLILQPLVENALNHGIMNSMGKCTLTINGCKSDGYVIFEIIDDGKGMSAEKLEKLKMKLAGSMEDYPRENMGIMNVKYRLHLCYGDKYQLKIESMENEGTKVIVSIPVDENRKGEGI